MKKKLKPTTDKCFIYETNDNQLLPTEKYNKRQFI